MMLTWLKQVPSSILQKSMTPLVGFPPAFPWEQFSERLAKLLELQSLVIKPKQAVEWRENHTIFSGLGDHPVTLSFSLAPQGGAVWWVMPEEDLSVIMSILLTKNSHPHTISHEFQEGLYQFLALETIEILSTLDFEKDLAIHIEHIELPKNEMLLCMDIAIEIEQKTLWGRLILSPELQAQWKERHAQRTLEAPLMRFLDLTVHLEAGHTTIEEHELEQLQPGDFITLDHCSLHANGEGRVMLTVFDMPLFRAKIKGGNIKLIEQPHYHEVKAHMEKNGKNGSSHPEQSPPKGESEPPEEEFIEGEEEGTEEEVASPSAEALQPPVESEEKAEEDEEEWKDEEIEGLPKEEKWPPPPESREELAAKQAEAATATEEEKKPFSIGDVPVVLTVEVGRLQMSVKQLLELQPGTILELDVHPENGIDLVVNGKRIAKGELIQVGDLLGVRILDIL